MPSPERRCAAIVVAGGQGSRFGGLKQFAELGSMTVAARSVAACRVIAETVILVAPEGMVDDAHGADQIVVGGVTRASSVRAGLNALDEAFDVVIVHDAARPLATERLFYAVVAELTDEKVDGAIGGVPVTDTIKQVREIDGRRRVERTLDRTTLVAVQTPQAFRADVLRTAHAGDLDATDDAALIEALGGLVVVVSGEAENLKITSPVDLAVAEQILALR